MAGVGSGRPAHSPVPGVPLLHDLDSPADDSAPATGETQPASAFAELGLSDPIVRAVAESGYVTPTPIQAQAIPYVLMGRDVLGSAQTGTGKTASFTLPMLDIMAGHRARARMPRALILEPTRELAAQVADNFTRYARHTRFEFALVIGGESMGDQISRLNRGVDALIATPGRLLDLFERGGLLLTDVKILVIDEADRMLDMGFIPDVERIVSLLSPMRQTLFFSATMPPEIRRLADRFLQNPKEISVARPATVATTVTAGLVMVRPTDKREALRRLLRAEEVKNALIFCNRKRDVDILYRSLARHDFNVGALHGDMVQSRRTETLEKFKAGAIDLLVCSDVAARGLDIGGLSHVFNFDVPYHAEDYVHRIGRTGRAGREGRAFTIAAPEDARSVAAIERLTGAPIPRVSVDGLDPLDGEALAESDEPAGRRGGRGRAPAGRRGERAGGPARAEPGKTPAEGKPPAAPPARERQRPPAPARGEPARGHQAGPPGKRAVKPDQPERAPEAEAPVRGFGDAVPAFMLLQARPARQAAAPGVPSPSEAEA
ncbi:MAG: DEAD/DEAH box helicase, partial [Acetobacteraceae bacterium]|nr:DEAD/DEAH box helicase [Acetobacteraceae bacterium]